MIGDGENVLVAASRHANDHQMVIRLLGRHLHRMSERMRGLERRYDAFELAAQLEGFERFLVRCRDIGHALRVVEPGMFGTDAWIVEAGRDRMRFGDLAVTV